MTTVSPPVSRASARAADLLWLVLALVSCLATARLILISPQLGCAAAVVIITTAAAVRSLSAGLYVMWSVWLLAPLVRRLFALDGAVGVDPLSLAPFLATFAVVFVELRRSGAPPRGDRAIPAVAALGFALGVPVGLASPEAGIFAAFAYAASLAGFVLGYHERTGTGDGTLVRLLRVGAPLLALYGVYQYFALPDWDRVWLQRANFVVALAPESDRVRIWGTLNAPGTFGMVLGLALVAFLVSRRFDLLRLAGVIAVITALALTYVRSAWVALAFAAAVLLVGSRGRMAPRIAVALAVAVIGIPALAAGTPTGQAIIGRFDTFSTLGSDTSAQERQQTASMLFPRAITEPLGSGLGSAGEASRLADTQGFRYTDNAYLSLLYQVGPFGFVLVIGALIAALRRAWRGARRRGSGSLELAVLGMLAFMLFGMLTGDLFYGVTGVAFWYLLGLAIKREHVTR